MISEIDAAATSPVNCTGGTLCPLNRVRAGTCVRIKQLPESSDLTTRLREIGLGEEQTVRLVSAHATVICQVCNARLALSTELAESILVEPLPVSCAA